MARVKGTVAAMIFGGIFAIIGYFVAFHFGAPGLAKAEGSKDWATAAGVVKRSEVQRSRDSDGDTMYSSDIEYEYTVGEKTYTGDRVYFGDNAKTSSAGGARETVARYPVGREVKVRYDPGAPHDSVLEPGVTWSARIPFLIGLGFFVIGLLVLGAPLIKLAVSGALLAYATRKRSPSPTPPGGFESQAGSAASRDGTSSQRSGGSSGPSEPPPQPPNR